MAFVNLHNHTEWSLLDGMCKVNEMVDYVRSIDQKAVAITDHGVLYGMVEFYKECIKTEDKDGNPVTPVKPIIGVEAYVVDDMNVREPSRGRDYSHLVLLAKNDKGLENIIKIVSEANLKGFYYKPRIDHAFLREHGEGIICLSACLGGEIAQFILNDDMQSAIEIATFYNDIFDDFYLEIQAGITPEQDKMNEGVVELSKITGFPIVVTNDAHYIRQEDAKIHDILLAIQTGKTLDDPDRWRFDSDIYWLKSEEETRRYLLSRENISPEVIEEAIANTSKIADMCNVTITLGKTYYPEYKIPEGYTLHSYLKEQAERSLFEYAMEEDIDLLTYKEKLDYELEVIDQSGLSGYLLIVQDYVNFAKRKGIPVGPGRGCFTPETQIYLSSGATKPISEINVGDKVINRFCEEDLVINKLEYDIEEQITELTTMYGAEPIRVTKDHKILAIKSSNNNQDISSRNLQWIKANDLSFGDYVVLTKTRSCSSLLSKVNLSDGITMEDENYIYVMVLDKKTIPYKGKVYDLSIEKDPSFMTSNFIAHNSAAGSLTVFLLGITDVDPIKHSLDFHRFYVPGRKGRPDIDMDFCRLRRQEVLDYVIDKYGVDRVAHIGTFGTMGAKTTLRDTARVLGFPMEVSDSISNAIPKSITDEETGDRVDITLDSALEDSAELRQYKDKYPEIFNIASKLEGLPRHTSSHAAGIVIAPVPLFGRVPLMRNKKEGDPLSITQMNMDNVEELGFLKMDFLGLEALTTIKETLSLIKEQTGKEINLRRLPLNDDKVFEKIRSLETLGVFQVGTNVGKAMCMKIQPSSFNELVDILALGRPGPMKSGQDKEYVAHKNGWKTIEYVHPLMEPILKNTYGVFVYQEQIMQATRDLAGFSYAESDKVRKAMGKLFAPLLSNK